MLPLQICLRTEITTDEWNCIHQRALTLINNKASIDSRSFTSKLQAVKELLKRHNDHESQESDCHKMFLLGRQRYVKHVGHCLSCERWTHKYPFDKSTNLFAGSFEQQFPLKVPNGDIQPPFSSFFIAPIWYKNTLKYCLYCANCHLNSLRSGALFYIFFIQSVNPSRAVSCLMKGSVSSNHLDICRCFEASLCALLVSVHSRRSPQATSWPQLSETSSRRTRRELFGGEESARWKSIKTWEGVLLLVGGIEEGGLQITTGSPDDAAAAAAEGKTTITGTEWCLLMVFRLTIKYCSMWVFDGCGII